MNQPPPATPRPGFPPSPCIRLCVLDERQVCTGCKRNIDEIIGWARMSADEQWAVINDLGDRK